MNNKKRSIKHYLILPSYQLRLVLFMSLVVLAGSIMHIVFLNYITARNLSDYFSQSQIEQIWDILRPAIVVTNIFSFVPPNRTFIFYKIALYLQLNLYIIKSCKGKI